MKMLCLLVQAGQMQSQRESQPKRLAAERNRRPTRDDRDSPKQLYYEPWLGFYFFEQNWAE
jgi:hypothetical protein